MRRKAQQARQVLKDFNFSTSDGFEADARKATDQAIRQAYDVLNALAVLSPSSDLSSLVTVLFGIEDRAKLYYISGGSSSGGGSKPTPTPDGGGSDDQGGGSDDGGDTPTPTPTPDPTPTPTPDPSGGGDE